MGLNKLTIIFAIVVFPLPLSPTSPKEFPSCILNETVSTAKTLLRDLSVKKPSLKV